MRHIPLRIMTAALLALLLIVSLPVAGAPRYNTAPAMEGSLVPQGEVDLTLLTLSDDTDQTVTFPNGVNGLILLIQPDGDVHEGDDTCSQTNDLYRPGGSIYSLPVSGRTAWHFRRRSGAGTVTVRMKLYLAN